MVYLTNCIYCNGSILNARWHDECRVAKLEDFLNQIQKNLKKIRGLPKELREEIQKGSFGTWEQFQKNRIDQRDKQWSQQVHDTLKSSKMQELSQEYDKKHPPPNAPKATKCKR